MQSPDSLKNSLIIYAPNSLSNADKASIAWALYPDKTRLVSIRYVKNTDEA